MQKGQQLLLQNKSQTVPGRVILLPWGSVLATTKWRHFSEKAIEEPLNLFFYESSLLPKLKMCLEPQQIQELILPSLQIIFQIQRFGL